MEKDSAPPSPRFRPQLYALRLASALGAVVSFLLVGQHIEYATRGALNSPLCQVGGWFNCEAVEASGYTALFDIPIASIGLYYFAVLCVLAWFVRPDPSPEGLKRWQGWFAWSTLPALIFVWGLAMLSALVIDSFCLRCTIVYGVMLICALAVVLVSPYRYFNALAEIPQRLKSPEFLARMFQPRLRRRIAFALGALVLAAVVNFGLPVWMIHKTAATPAVTAWLEQPIVDLKPPREGLSEGEPKAALRIIVFTDFACPYCARFEKDLEALLLERRGDYFLGFKHYPLSRKCNPIMKRASFDHKHACRLAQMAEALADQGRFNELRDRLYAPGVEELYPLLKEVAEKAGLDYGAWAAAAMDPAVRARVEADIREGLELGIRALPAVYVNGRPLPSIDPAKVEEVLSIAEREGR